MATSVLASANGFESVMDEPGLEQRQRPGKGGAENGDYAAEDAVVENGFHADGPPAFSEVAEFEGEVAATPAVGEEEPESESLTKLYFVRIPRPNVDETIVKKLQTDFQAQVNKIKGLNQKIQTKRGAVIELKKQLSMARSLKNGSQPEYQEKSARLRQVKDLRKQYSDQSASIKENLRGLECKSEEELEERIKELEHQIQHEPMTLREEKNIVQLISKLVSQRGKVKEYGGQTSTLTELQAERTKITTVIKEMEDEFKILQNERDEAQRIIDDLQGKLKKADDALKEDQEEQEQAVTEKNNILAKLDQARLEIETHMKDYRENRKFSMQVRDLVAAGKVEDAQNMCLEQTETFTVKINTDSVFRKQYTELMAQQRRYVVSELLPASCKSIVEMPKPKEAPKAVAKTKPAAGAAKVLTGADKVKAVIDAALQEASREAHAIVRSKVVEDSDDDEDDEPVKPLPKKEEVKPVVPAKPVIKPAEPVKVDLPNVPELKFELPEIVKTSSDEAVSEEEMKARLRDEQRRKAQEAEERKKKQAELAAKKKAKAEELKRKKELAEKNKPVVAAVEEVVEAEVTVVERSAPVPTEPAAPSQPVPPPIVKVTKTAQAKRPKDDKLIKKIKKWLKAHNVELAVAGFILLLALMFVLVK